eukprot:586983-Pleurochrysis_carterae.AAC.1
MLPASCAMWATIVENPVSSRTVAGVGARAVEGAATFPTAGTVVSTGTGATIFLFVGRAALAGARVIAARRAADAAASTTTGVAFSASENGARGGGGAACSPVALAGLDD